MPRKHVCNPHYWVIGSVAPGGLAHGVCRHCLEERDFPGTFSDIASVWRYERWLSKEEAVAFVTQGRYQVVG